MQFHYNIPAGKRKAFAGFSLTKTEAGDITKKAPARFAGQRGMGYEDKCFAAGCSRDVIRIGAERLGRQLDELLSHTPDAMRACEKTVDDEMAAQ